MTTTPAKKIATIAAATSMLVSAVALAPTASATTPPTTISAGATPASSALPAAQGDNATLIRGWYHTFLHRDAKGDPGARYWVDRLDVQAPADVAWALAHSIESNNDKIIGDDGYYSTYLDAQLNNNAGVDYWLDGVDAGRFPLEWVLQNVLASPAYARRTFNTPLVPAWYRDVLNRQPSAGESAYWNARVARVGRLGALRELWYSPEAVSHRISNTYHDELGRQPSAGEIAYWYPKEVESDINVAVLIASTPEYRDLILSSPGYRDNQL